MAARIAAAIKSLPEMTQDRLGEIVGVSQGQVSHWTGGRLPVPALKAAKVAKALHIDDPAEISTEYREIVGSQSTVRSQPARLDPERIAETAKALRVHYERMSKVFNIEDEPALFVQVYRMCEELLDERTPDNLVEFGSWLQRVAPEGVEGRGMNEARVCQLLALLAEHLPKDAARKPDLKLVKFQPKQEPDLQSDLLRSRPLPGERRHSLSKL